MKAPPKSKAPKELSKYENPTWSELYRRLKRIMPYLWPKDSARLQFLAVRNFRFYFNHYFHYLCPFSQFLCIIVLLVGRVVTVALPLTLGALLDVFDTQYWSNPPPPHPKSFWPYLLAYVGLRFLQGSGGLAALRDVSVQSVHYVKAILNLTHDL